MAVIALLPVPLCILLRPAAKRQTESAGI
jgi:hypothetical protein